MLHYFESLRTGYGFDFILGILDWFFHLLTSLA